MSKVIEIIIYVHGVSNDIHGRKHEVEYQTLHHGIATRLNNWPSRYIGIEWGWNFKNVAIPSSHELLTDAQRLLGARVIQALDAAPRDMTINPGRLLLGQLRKLVIYGMADMFYYISKDGEKAVRNTVASQIMEQIHPFLAEKGLNISLTLIGHSGGGVVALDFLFYLFYTSVHEYLFDAHTKKEKELKTEISHLRSLAQNNKLRLRRLISLGCPVTALAFRDDAVLEILASGDKLNPSHYGFDRNPTIFGPRLKGPRWVNFWDKDDPIAWPVEPLMNQGATEDIIKDVYIDISDSITTSHDAYWASSKVHEAIANTW
jgi:hypothetical protein